MRLTNTMLLLAFCALPAAAQWTDNGDGTHTYEKTTTPARWTMAVAHLTLRRNAVFLCDAAAVADSRCPASMEGERFPFRKPLICIDADVPDRCDSVADRWKVPLIRCEASAPYEKWPEGGTTSNAIYADACKATFKTGRFWIPEWVNTKRIWGRRVSPGPPVVLGEQTILAQGYAQGTETE